MDRTDRTDREEDAPSRAAAHSLLSTTERRKNENRLGVQGPANNIQLLLHSGRREKQLLKDTQQAVTICERERKMPKRFQK